MNELLLEVQGAGRRRHVHFASLVIIAIRTICRKNEGKGSSDNADGANCGSRRFVTSIG